MSWNRTYQRFCIITVIGAILATMIAMLSPVRVFENFLADVRVSHYSIPSDESDQIVIIAIDDESLEDFAYTSPINRNLLATVVQRLDKLGASVIAVDILLDRPSEAVADQALLKAISSANAPVILISDPGRESRDALCDNQPLPPRIETIDPAYANITQVAHGVVCPDSLDDVVRRAPVARGDHLSFAEAIASAHADTTFENGSWLNVPFRTGEKFLWPFRTFSASMVDILPAAWIEDRIVLIGPISPYSGDFFASPLRFSGLEIPVEPSELLLQSELPGVVIHAFSVQGLLSDQVGHHLSPWNQIPYILLGAVLGAVLVGRRLGLIMTLGGLGVILVTFWWLILAIFAWSSGVVLVPFTGFASALLVVSGTLFAVQEREERDRRRFVEEGFSHFLSRKRVDEIINSPEALRRTAEERDVTILFTDLEGFTSLVDIMPPEQLAPTLNGYLDDIIDTIARYDGTVDKIVGDAVHAMFSAPLQVPKHRLKALRCALDILDITKRYQVEKLSEGIGIGRTRIGLSCGPALVGNFGSSKRFDYTAHGSVVNLAARLEAENKTFGTSICLSEPTLVPSDDITYREIGDVRVRGIAQQVSVFEALRSTQITAEQLQAYQTAFALKDQNLPAALAGFNDLLTKTPDDGLVAYQVARLSAMIEV